MTVADNPAVSVIIPWQGEAVLFDTVRSLLAAREAQNNRQVEVLVVASAPLQLDGQPTVTVIQLDRPLWAGAARNRGLSLARGDTVVFLDADCVPQPGWLGGIVRSQRQPDLICSGAIAPSADTFERLCYNLVGFREFIATVAPGPRQFLPSFCLWGPRRAFVEADGFNESLQSAEDLDLTARLNAAGWEMRFEPSVQVLHRPSIRSLNQLMLRGWRHGQNSIRVRHAYPTVFRQPSWMFHPLALALGAPLVATVFWVRTATTTRLPLAVAARVGPVALTYRTLWCLGAARTQLRELARADGPGVDLRAEEG